MYVTLQNQNYSNKICHAFLDRNGGLSSGGYFSLNCGLNSNDDRSKITQNLELAIKLFNKFFKQDFKVIKLTKQVHSNSIVVVNDLRQLTDDIEADGLVTKLPGILLGVYTADCSPILLWETKNQIISAIHVGWRGAIKGIIDKAILAIKNLGGKSENIISIIGPTIGQSNYEVDSSFHLSFITNDKRNEQFFYPSKRDNHFMFNLPAYCKFSLENNNVAKVYDTKLDTYNDSVNFFSCRRFKKEQSYNNQGNDFGCQLSIIGIPDHR